MPIAIMAWHTWWMRKAGWAEEGRVDEEGGAELSVQCSMYLCPTPQHHHAVQCSAVCISAPRLSITMQCGTVQYTAHMWSTSQQYSTQNVDDAFESLRIT